MPSLLLITYSKKPLRDDEVLLHVKNLGGRFSLTLSVDDVDNEPPVLLDCNISLSISSAGAQGIKCTMVWKYKKEWQILGSVA